MKNVEYLEYKGFEKEIKDTLESQYTMAMYNGDTTAAYEMLGKMMAYKLIDQDDPRIEKTNKSYIKAGIAKDHRFHLDYRKDYNFIPAWLYGNVTASKVINVSTAEHWGKRVEGNYEGDTIFPSRNMALRLRLCQNERAVENAFDGIVKIMQANKLGINREEVEKLCKEGVYRVYEINVDDNCLIQYKNIGYTVIKMGNEVPEGTFFINYNSLIGNWLPIKKIISALKTVQEDMVKESKYRLAINADSAIEQQRGLMDKSNNMTIAMNKQAEKQA